MDYNEWEFYKKDLEKLYSDYSKLPDEIEEEVLKEEEQPPKKIDPVCDKFYPFDYGPVFGLPALLPSLFTVKEHLQNEYGNLMYESVYVDETGKKWYYNEKNDLVEYQPKINKSPIIESDNSKTPEKKVKPHWEFEKITEDRPVAIKDGYAFVNTRNSNKIRLYWYTC